MEYFITKIGQYIRSSINTLHFRNKTTHHFFRDDFSHYLKATSISEFPRKAVYACDDYKASKEYEKAERYIQTLVETDNKNQALHLRLAVISLCKNDIATSRMHLSRIFKLAPGIFHKNLILRILDVLENEGAGTFACTSKHLNHHVHDVDSIRFLDENLFHGSVRFHIDTLPRSGTHFFISNVQSKRFLDYASFGPDALRRINNTPFYAYAALAGDIFFSFPPIGKQYVLKTHYFQPFRSDRLLSKNAITIRQLSFLPDALYSWAHLLGTMNGSERARKYAGYRVTPDLPEWSILRNRLSKLPGWLVSRNQTDTVRYEDYANPTHPLLEKTAKALRMRAADLFDNFAPDTRRLYYLSGEEFTATARQRFDDSCLAAIVETFRPHLARFYPEKMEAIDGLALR